VQVQKGFGVKRSTSERHWLRAGLVAALCVLGAPAAPVFAHDEPTVARQAARIEGVWIPEFTVERLLTEAGEAPPLNAQGAALYREREASRNAPDPQFDRTRWCAGPGIPRIMYLPYPFEIRADGDYVGFIYGWYRWHRMVDMSGKEANPILPQSMGYPVGKWDGDALIIETVGTTSDTILDALGLPHSEDMTITERVNRLPDGRLQVRFRINDPAFYTSPWETVMTYRSAPELVVGDDVCPDRLVRGEAPIRSRLP
jgi:hypothetical protein